MKKVTINLIIGEKLKDDFFHAVDIFEPFKHFGENVAVDYELEKSDPDLGFITRFKDQSEKNGFNVIAIWIAKTPEIHIIDWDVEVVSNGVKWFMLEKYLKQFGITKQH